MAICRYLRCCDIDLRFMARVYENMSVNFDVRAEGKCIKLHKFKLLSS